MLSEIVTCLACPHCADELEVAEGALRCRRGHVFDVARQGYVSLLAGNRAAQGDGAEMVAARERFLEAGYYAPIVEAVGDAAAQALSAPAQYVLDLGAGTGYYLSHVLECVGSGARGVAVDASKYAARRAAKRRRVGAVVCDAWRGVPVQDSAVDLVLDVFAPRNGAEMHRILRPGGVLVVVTPTPRHLAEAVTALDLLAVDERKDERLAEQLRPHLSPVAQDSREFTMNLEREALGSVAEMGPSAWHADHEALRERIAHVRAPLPVSASVTITTYRRRD